MKLHVIANESVDVDRRAVEAVERKGIGHPDTLADAIADEISRRYSRFWLHHFGRVAHHWFDKVIVLGGEADLGWGVGRLTHPLTVIVIGKAALRMGSVEVPMEDLAAAATQAVFRRSLPAIDCDRDVRYEIRVNDFVGAGRPAARYRPASVDDLADGSVSARSNDSVICSAFAPMSRLEKLVLELETWLTSPEFKAEHPATGYDVKVIGIRVGDDADVVVRLPFLAGHLASLGVYAEAGARAGQAIEEWLAGHTDLRVSLLLNSDDAIGNVYLTATGSVADTGDHGVVGRGNRANGLITPARAMSIEAPAGKNPADHTGKLYAELCTRIAADAVAACGKPVSATIATGRGRPIEDPLAVLVEAGVPELEPELQRRLYDLAAAHVAEVTALPEDFLAEEWLSIAS
jgi:S-adenosylmethionine synthetase